MGRSEQMNRFPNRTNEDDDDLIAPSNRCCFRLSAAFYMITVLS